MTRLPTRSLLPPILAAACVASASAQSIPIVLNYNFNGIVHAGEAGLPDDLSGFRSISDRALDFQAGLPNDPILNAYQLVAAPGLLDIVHLGNRNTVDNGTKAFEPTANGNDIGVQPAWLINVDQTGPQTTVLTTPMPITATSRVAFIYQISNGGGSFDVTFTFLSGGTHTATLSGGDWFGGPLAGTANVDNGLTGNNLSVTEGRINMGAFDGEVVTQLSFDNASNPNAGHAILACNFEYPPPPSRVNQIPLNYNFNGIAHFGEPGLPDDLVGYRSISDRGLNFTGGVPNNPLLAPYLIVDQPLLLDIVHLGNRDTVDNGNWAFEPTANGNNIGIQPAWLPNVDQSGPQVTILTDPIILDATSSASVLFQISNGGGDFDVEFQFSSGAPVVATITGPDWFGGVLAGVAGTDSAAPGANLSLTERTIDLTAEAGRTLTGIIFQNASNANSGCAIIAMNVVGCMTCTNGAQANVTNLGGGTIGVMSSSSTGRLGCDLNWTVTAATPTVVGVFAAGLGITAAPLSIVLPGCPGTIHVPNPAFATVPTDPFGGAAISLPVPTTQALCGQTVTAQYVELQTGPCALALTDAIAITIGN